MKTLIDFFPILLFFGAYKFYDIYVGTAVLMGATVLQMARDLRHGPQAAESCTRSRWR